MTPEEYTAALAWRGIEAPCPRCGGSGRRVYGSTATWRGGMGGAACTDDVCDECWGSGDSNRPGANLRSMMQARADWESEQVIMHFARGTGATLSTTRAHMTEIANILDREARRKKTPFDAERFWWFSTLKMVSSALRRFALPEEVSRG